MRYFTQKGKDVGILMDFMTDDFDGFNDSEDFDEINKIDRSKTFFFLFKYYVVEYHICV